MKVNPTPFLSAPADSFLPGSCRSDHWTSLMLTKEGIQMPYLYPSCTI
jgi:hypothetical protein